MFARADNDSRDDTHAPAEGEFHTEGTEPEAQDGEPDDVAALMAKLEALEEEKQSLLRIVADERNRSNAARREIDEARRQSVTSVARDVITALDTFDLALGQDLSGATAEQVVSGVRAIREELLRALARHGVGVVEPGANDEFDPVCHQAVMRRAADGVEPGRIVTTLQAGYMLHERVIRPAKVAVAPAEDTPGGPSTAAGDHGQEQA